MGHVKMVGGNPTIQVPVAGILSSDLSVGSIVYLMWNGSPIEYRVVNQGIPSNSSLYDSSCDGTWLLQNVVTTSCDFVKKDSGYDNAKYSTSYVHSYLNSEYFEKFGSIEKEAIKPVKIPCIYRSEVFSGENGLEAKVISLSSTELGVKPTSATHYPTGEGAILSYFEGTKEFDSKRILYGSSGNGVDWWIRTSSSNRGYLYFMYRDGGLRNRDVSEFMQVPSYCVRPAVILPKTALFDEETMILKGVL